MGPPRPRPVVLDAGALIAFNRNDRAVRRLIELTLQLDGTVHVPVGVVGQVWRDGARQARLARLIRARGVKVTDLDLPAAQSAGVLCGATGTSDVVDASVALLALHHGAVVVTGDPDDLRRLSPGLELILC